MKRPYKEPWAIDRVMAHLQTSAGTHFEPALVTVFFSILPEVLDIQRQWAAAE
jgi:putative two-component system response regulator